MTDTDFDWYGPDVATFGDRLSFAREAANMAQAALARRLGVKLATLKAWEEDRSEPRANRLQLLSGILGVSLSWLINGQGDGPSDTFGQDSHSKTVSDLLIELRSIRTEITTSVEKLGLVEKRLRLMAAENEK